MTIADKIQDIRGELPQEVTLVCVSKYQSEEAIMEAYNAGERDFGESHVQELCKKHEDLPKDIRWHMIGHLQTNKVKYIVPFVHLIHSVDSWKLLETINREAGKIGRKVAVLLEVHVAQEQTKSGMSLDEAAEVFRRLQVAGDRFQEDDGASEHSDKGTIEELPWVDIQGLMTMATNTDDEQEIRRCFSTVRTLWKENLQPATCHLQPTLSMGMSDDYPIAIEEGSNMIRVGSKIFGDRTFR